MGRYNMYICPKCTRRAASISGEKMDFWGSCEKLDPKVEKKFLWKNFVERVEWVGVNCGHRASKVVFLGFQIPQISVFLEKSLFVNVWEFFKLCSIWSFGFQCKMHVFRSQILLQVEGKTRFFGSDTTKCKLTIIFNDWTQKNSGSSQNTTFNFTLWGKSG